VHIKRDITARDSRREFGRKITLKKAETFTLVPVEIRDGSSALTPEKFVKAEKRPEGTSRRIKNWKD